MYKIDEVLAKIEENNVRWLEMQFVNLLGYLHSLHVSTKILSKSWFDEGIGKLDGSSVKGFTEVSKSDLRIIPIAETFNILPWSKSGSKIARFICKIGDMEGGGRYKFDTRYIAEKLEEYLKSKGLTVYIGVETEFFVFNKIELQIDSNYQVVRILSVESPKHTEDYPYTEKEAYYMPEPLDKLVEYRIRLSNVLEDYFGINVDSHHHEVAASGQIEINIRCSTLLKSCDNFITLKYVSRMVADEFKLYPTFMPKPLYGDNGSGAHVNLSIWRNSDNLFYDPNDEYAELSQYARYFIGGLIEHGRSLSAIVSPTVNSYKRLVPGYEAPIYLTWAKGNRSAAIRIPIYNRGDKNKRIEYRPPDPSINPYLAISAILLAGLDGVKKKIDPGDPVDKNIYKLSKNEIRELRVKALPRNLLEAIEELKCDNEYLKPYFTQELIEKYIEYKIEEDKRVNSYPTPAEFKEYFHL